MAKEKHDFKALTVQHPLDRNYDSIEFTVANGQTNYDVKANETNAFANFQVYTTVNIRTDQDITIRFNATTNIAITIPKKDSPFEMDNLIEITNMYITNSSGSTANVKIIGVNKEA